MNKTSRPSIDAIILTHNEEEMIANCIETLRWCDHIWVVDQQSTDSTVELAEKLGATVVPTKHTTFAEKRNAILSQITADWIVYIDADERVTPQLSKEILVQIETTQANALSFWRDNMLYGVTMQHGGWPEKMARVFRKSNFGGWKGDIHESPVFEGEAVLLHSSLIHLTHRNTIDGLRKTIAWTPMEAKLLADSKIAPVKPRTIFRKGMMEFLRRGFLKGGYKDGVEGVIEAMVQGINRMLVYIQVWELQKQSPLSEKYQAEERHIAQLWKNDV